LTCFSVSTGPGLTANTRTPSMGDFSRDRIDGAVACAMAVARASAGDSSFSIYSNVEERPAGLLFV